MALFPRVRAELEKRGMGHVLLTGGGIIPGDDMRDLEAKGFTKLFGPGTRTEEIAHWIQQEVARRRAAEQGASGGTSGGASTGTGGRK